MQPDAAVYESYSPQGRGASPPAEEDTHPLPPPQSELWAPNYHFGLLHCCSHPGLCVENCFCVCCTTSRIQNMVRNGHGECDPVHVTVMLCCHLGCMVPRCWSAYVRRVVSERFQLTDRSAACDYIEGCFCDVCSNVQIQKELAYRHMYPGACCATEEDVCRKFTRPLSPMHHPMQ